MIIAGRYSSLIFLMIFSIIIFFIIQLGKRGKILKIRKLPAIDAIDEVVGRAAEMGKPLLYTVGGYLDNVEAPQAIAGFTILDYVAHKTAKMGVELITCPRYATHIPIAHEIVREAYRAEGVPDMFKPENIQYYSDTQFAFATGVMGTIARERPASFIMIGAWWAEALMFLETAVIYGVMSIGGTANTHQIPWIVLCTSYTLFGEEIFAAGAYLSKDPVSVGTIGAGDAGRYIIIALILLGAALTTLGIPILNRLLAT
ncbi:hypothetical protein KEJ48_04865 [Candidatus Bathyarchaeota archaeon]|nr:hypothetical protein [Candidatus Bathyarchaeota archaeon]